ECQPEQLDSLPVIPRAYDQRKDRRLMRLGDVVKNAPNALIWAVCLSFISIIACFTILSATGSDTTDLRSFLNLVLNIASGLFSGGALIVAGAAAKSSANAEKSLAPKNEDTTDATQ